MLRQNRKRNVTFLLTHPVPHGAVPMYNATMKESQPQASLPEDYQAVSWHGTRVSF